VTPNAPSDLPPGDAYAGNIGNEIARTVPTMGHANRCGARGKKLGGMPVVEVRFQLYGDAILRKHIHLGQTTMPIPSRYRTATLSSRRNGHGKALADLRAHHEAQTLKLLAAL